MMRRESLDDLFDDDDQLDAASEDSPPAGNTADEPPKTKEEPKPRGSGRRQASKNEPAEKEAGTAATGSPREPAKVLVPTNDEAKRAGLYLHQDDYRALGLAKLDDGADYNARIRAMIAVWRHDGRFRSKVDKLAKTAPRGPYSGSKSAGPKQ